MTPETSFTALEQRVVEAVCDMYPEIAGPLGALLATARVIDRKNTGAGFFTRFTVDQTLPPIVWKERMIGGPDPEVQAGDDVLLMGFLLWLEDGYPDCLEGYHNCTIDGREFDLNDTGLDGLQWLRDPFADQG